MSAPNDSVILLSRALDQLGDVLAAVHEDQLSQPTPCRDWDVGRLVAHIVADPGEAAWRCAGRAVPDWSSDPDPVAGAWTSDFRSAADDLIHFWHQLR